MSLDASAEVTYLSLGAGPAFAQGTAFGARSDDHAPYVHLRANRAGFPIAPRMLLSGVRILPDAVSPKSEADY